MNSRNAAPAPDPVIVVGSGVAGLLTAIRAAAHGDVVLVTKGELGHGSTQYAQGGIAAAMGDDDSPAKHAADTIAAGAGICDPEAVRITTEEGPRRIAELMRLGVAFDREHGRLALGREAAHGEHRIVHAGGDATGAGVVAALREVVRRDPRIALAEHETALRLLVRDGCVTGLETADPGGVSRVRTARAVVLATGGSGQLYARTTNPAGATGDGVALAAAAGAAVADLEMVQFHPTALAIGPSPLQLVSEAVRGEGAYLRDARGHRFMRDVHPLAELGPRDVVARAVARTALRDGRDVTLDLSHLDPRRVMERFPNIAAACAAHGLDLARDPIPVTPAAHYAIGGVLADMSGRTTLPGLYAVGECASTGLHGANRLASNSLLEGAVMAVRAAEDIRRGGEGWFALAPRPVRDPARGGTPDPGAADRIRELMWRHAGLERDEAGLITAAGLLDRLGTPQDHETRAMARTARLMVAAAAHRRESRGAHFRTDHPETRPELAHRIAWLGGEPFALTPARPARRRVSAATRAKEAA
ncbi:MAG: L-aspartate oxidase [Thermoleophilia bacterium]